MPTGVADLKKIGISRYLGSDSFYTFKGISYHSRNGDIATAPFAEGPGWGVHRPALSKALHQCAEETPGLTIQSGTTITRIERETSRIVVRTSKNDIINSRLLIGADGLNSKIRQWSGLSGPQQKLKRWGARQHFHTNPWSDYVEVHWGGGIEAYVTPCGQNLVEIAFLWDRYRNVAGGNALMSSLFEAFPMLQARVDGCKSNDDVKAVGPLSWTALSPVSDGILLIGDAAGYLDAITGEGISLATAQALSLGHTVGPLLRNHRDAMPTSRNLQTYRKTYHKIVRPYYMLTRLVLFLSRNPNLAERVIRTLRKRPDVFQTLLSINMGNIPSLPRLSATAMRLIAGIFSGNVIPDQR
jgi:flavin-dependent dehydrogenase